MMNSIVLLPLVALTLNQVEANRVNDVMTVTLNTSEPISVDRVKGMTGPQRMYVFINDTKSSAKTFDSQYGPIVAHTRTRYTKLEVPSGPGGRCLEPVIVEPTATGVRLRARCNDLAVATEPIVAPQAKTTDDQLRIALIPPKIDGNEEKAEVKERTTTEVESRNTQAVPSELGQGTSKKADVTVPMVMPSAPVPALHREMPTTQTPKMEGGFSLTLVMVLLAGLGVVAFVLARRRGTSGRMIHIVETASIGPKRSLVVANVSGRTMVLGVSEAGVTLLDTISHPVSEAQTEFNKKEVSSQEDTLPMSRLSSLKDKLLAGITGHKKMSALDRMDDENQPAQEEEKTESGLLGRLFSHRQNEQEEVVPTFQDVLDDSYEDQQLRQKLAAGVGGRVA